ncbi:unnamed protein product [Pylaiella littoralis]
MYLNIYVELQKYLASLLRSVFSTSRSWIGWWIGVNSVSIRGIFFLRFQDKKERKKKVKKKKSQKKSKMAIVHGIFFQDWFWVPLGRAILEKFVSPVNSLK